MTKDMGDVVITSLDDLLKVINNIPVETENGINLDHPVVKLFRKIELEKSARAEDSDLYCPKCNTNLPYNQMTIAPRRDGTDANYNPVYKEGYFCTLCQEYFDKKLVKNVCLGAF